TYLLDLLSFPTRRSSDLAGAGREAQPEHAVRLARPRRGALPLRPGDGDAAGQAARDGADRGTLGESPHRLRPHAAHPWHHARPRSESTRLNSSHVKTSYA